MNRHTQIFETHTSVILNASDQFSRGTDILAAARLLLRILFPFVKNDRNWRSLSLVISLVSWSFSRVLVKKIGFLRTLWCVRVRNVHFACERYASPLIISPFPPGDTPSIHSITRPKVLNSPGKKKKLGQCESEWSWIYSNCLLLQLSCIISTSFYCNNFASIWLCEVGHCSSLTDWGGGGMFDGSCFHVSTAEGVFACQFQLPSRSLSSPSPRLVQ